MSGGAPEGDYLTCHEEVERCDRWFSIQVKTAIGSLNVRAWRLYRSGRNQETAIANIREAITEYVAALEDDGLPVPDENFEAIVVAV